jgi:hypothetical protein
LAGITQEKKQEKKPEKEAPAVITPEIRRIWITIRRMWNLGFAPFSKSISALNDKQSGALYDVIRLSLYNDSYVEVLRKHPELKPLLLSDEDRLCMYDIYGVLSWRLNRREEPPKDRRLLLDFKGSIGRNTPSLD